MLDIEEKLKEIGPYVPEDDDEQLRSSEDSFAVEWDSARDRPVEPLREDL